MDYYINIILRLVIACILGGLIGYERELTNRPAGFRTHILVCVGSALVMVTSDFIFSKYCGQTSMDPARLGAQVISGIGFLGAGTIIREGYNVKGLTTAASLWAVACVGIAAGAGFYEGAVVATILIVLTLILLKKLEGHFFRKNRFKTLFIRADNVPGKIAAISSILERHSVVTRNIEFVNSEDDIDILIKLLIKLPRRVDFVNIINELHDIEGIKKVYEG